MGNSKYLKGSKWRKWDLQVQPTKNSWFSTLNDEKTKEQIRQSIQAYINSAIKKQIDVIAVTDHNTGISIDFAIEYANGKDIIILPGVELDANSGEHILVIFNLVYKDKIKKEKWSEVIDTFLQTKCKIEPPFFNDNNAKKLNITTEELIEVVNREEIGIVIFAHCTSNDGFFQRSGDASNRIKICKNFLEKDNFKYIFEIKEPSKKEEIIGKLQGWGIEHTKFPIISSSDANKAQNVGQFFTWIKADPTFEGLKQIVYEPEERVFIGEEPELLQRVRENKTKFIKTIKINHIEGYDEKNGIWFKNIEIPLSPGMVAIIGHKGSGKSALLDIIALCGNSHQEEKDFSFLNENRFKKGSLAKNFEAVLEWENGEQIIKNLNYTTDKTAPERVKYLPQNYFERLTNSLDSYEFEETLNNVVFSHLPEEQKLGKNSFEELISYKKEIIESEIKNIINDIEFYNKRIIDLEKKEHPNYLEKIKNELELKKKELEEHEKNKPQEVSKPQEENENTKRLQELKEQLEKNEKNIKKKYEENKNLLLEIEELNKIKQELSNFKREIDNYISENQERFEKYKLNSDDLIKIEVNTQLIEKLVESKTNQRNDNSQKIEELEKDNKMNGKKINEITSTLSEQQHKYEKYLTDLKKWNNKKQEIIGDDKTPNTIKWYEKEIDFVKNKLKEEINKLRKERISKSLEIYDKKNELVDIFKSLKDYVDKEIYDYQNILGEYEINIEATLKISEEFYNKFLSFINQKVKGSFRGEDDGLKILQELTKEINPKSNEEIEQFLNKIIEYLEYDQREKFDKERRFIIDQIQDKNINEFYKYLFSLDYINATYQLKLGDKELTQLSPGEKGALLIVFYLMLAKDNIPLLIDQPEENLDNESIYKILTHFIRLTKNERQIIIVTHNPNLAIVGDAEQIIFVNIDKKHGNKFTFESGAIENSTINKHASDILEGTLKAFDIRRLKYFGSKEDGKIS